jgi:XTP/dITP diphosphohydrolase
VLVYLPDPDAVPQVFEGVCGGRILEAPRGEGGFGYDPLFYSDELGRTFGEATAEEKDAVSHRGRAVRAFADALRSV